MLPSPPKKATSILPEPPAPTKAKQGAHGRLIAIVAGVAGVLLVAGVVTIAIVLTTTSDGRKNNHSDSPGVAGAYAAAFASSPPLTVATYDDCAQLLAARESSGPCPARGGADNAPRRIKELRGGRCRSPRFRRMWWPIGGPSMR